MTDRVFERTGYTKEQAQALLDNAKALLAPETIKAARAEWQELAWRLRGCKGQPFLCREHPEAVRLQMVRYLTEGASVKEASNRAYEFAGMPEGA